MLIMYLNIFKSQELLQLFETGSPTCVGALMGSWI